MPTTMQALRGYASDAARAEAIRTIGEWLDRDPDDGCNEALLHLLDILGGTWEPEPDDDD